jgi:hypothetical protein
LPKPKPRPSGFGKSTNIWLTGRSSAVLPAHINNVYAGRLFLKNSTEALKKVLCFRAESVKIAGPLRTPFSRRSCYHSQYPVLPRQNPVGMDQTHCFDEGSPRYVFVVLFITCYLFIFLQYCQHGKSYYAHNRSAA